MCGSFGKNLSCFPQKLSRKNSYSFFISSNPITIKFVDDQTLSILQSIIKVMLDTIAPFSDFASAARNILSYLHHRLGFRLWMVTRTQEENWIMLQVEDHGYGVQEGDVFCWSDSFCSRMVNGEGPCIAPRVSTVPAYREAPIGKQVSIGAYIGIPIVLRDGSFSSWGVETILSWANNQTIGILMRLNV